MKVPRFFFVAVVAMAVLTVCCFRITKHQSKTNAKGPHLQLPREPVDLGNMQPDEKVKRTFEVRNSGDEPLRIAKVTANCGCTEPTIDRDLLLAGETATVTVIFDSSGFYRNVRKQVVLESNDAVNAVAVVYLSGYVQIGLRADTTVLNLGRVRLGQSAGAEMHLFRDTGRAAGPIKLSDPTKSVTAEIGPWLPYLKSDRARIRVQIASVTDDLGIHRRDVTLETGSYAFPVRLDYEVVPIVEYSPGEVVFSAVSAQEHTVRLSWSGHHVVFEKAESQGGKCQTELREVGEAECSLLILPSFPKVPPDGDFDLIRVDYRLSATGRREFTTIPVVFLGK